MIVVTSFDRIDRIAHELAYLTIKRHTWRFWKIVGIIYPEYERGKEELLKIVRKDGLMKVVRTEKK
jgi:hypothetical protein